MARVAAPDRLARLAGAATESFGRVGYRRTRTDEVAKAAGMSAGALFNYVDSKDALFHLVFLVGFNELEATPALPLHVARIDETIDLIKRGLRRTADAPHLAAAIRNDDPTDVGAELDAIVAEMFAFFTQTWRLLAAIERSASDMPELEAFYFRQGRAGRRKQLEQYVSRRVASGHFRSSVDAVVAGRLLLETAAWFAWHRREDRDAALYDDDRTLAGLTTLLRDALLEPER